MNRGARHGETGPVRVEVCTGEVWDVPRGFGSDYRRRLDPPSEPWELITILERVGYTSTPEAVAAWPLRRRIEAEAYAARVHLRASDNALRAHPKPAWMGEPWQGPTEGTPGTVWEQAGCTVLP